MEPTTDPLSIAYYCTGHGLGHATRSIEVCKHLVERGHTVTVVTGAPAKVFLQELPSARFVLRKAVLDAGAKQLDPFTVDVKGSLEQYYNTVMVHRDSMLAAEVQWLRSNHIDLVVSDVVPLACAAAADAGIPAVCVSNFSWDFIYSEYLTTQRTPEYRQLVWQIAQDYSAASLLLRLPGYVPMPAFMAIEDVPLVVRHARKSSIQVREELGLLVDARLAVLIHGGHKAELRATEDFLPPGWVCVACNGGRPLSPNPLPANFRLAPAEVYTPDLVAACDCVIGKIGYGTLSECLAHKKPLVFVRRDFFNEEPFLRKMLEMNDAAVEMKRRDFLAGHWGPYLERACSLQVRYMEPTNGAEVVAARLEQVGHGQLGPGHITGLARLRDTVVFGYLMATPKHGRVDVPDWYVNGANPNRRLGSCSNLNEVLTDPEGAGINTVLQDWQVIEGETSKLRQLPDTLAFLQLLHQLHSPPRSSSGSPAVAQSGSSSPEIGDAQQAAASSNRGGTVATAAGPVGGNGQSGTEELPEVRAARALFRWDAEVLVTRAPGRLDVMGGIADYSGSLVLQMPIAEACHVALQRHLVGKQPLWKHIQARHEKLDGPRPALCVVSYHADDTNRAPTFDLDLTDMYQADGSPIPYQALQEYFKKDPASRWGAYVAGCLLVLAHEKGLVYTDGISILACSDVPEGKGVSSSAALEVAVMSAVAAAHGLTLGGRELALLCQKAENLVVGAPCGVMDQLTASLGEAGQLLALLCQPAEVQRGVQIPPQIRFWGVDSGIRHHVGSSDYSSVRVGAFMGLKIISKKVQQQQLALARDPSTSLAAAVTAAALGQCKKHASVGHTAASARGNSSSDVCSKQAAVGLVQQGLLHQQDDQQQPHHQSWQQQQHRPRASSNRQNYCSNASDIPPAFGGYLANIRPSQYQDQFEFLLPSQMLGFDFLQMHGSHLDHVTEIDPQTSYSVQNPAAHPIRENFMANTFRALLAAADTLSDAAAAASASIQADREQSVGDSTAGYNSNSAEQQDRQHADAACPITAAAADEPEGKNTSAQPHQADSSSYIRHSNGNHSRTHDTAGQQHSSSSSSSSSSRNQQSLLEHQYAGLLGPLETLGELMFQSHASYNACGLGSDGTDRLINIVRQHMLAARQAGRAPALYGAKITGGGSGGTVCVLGLADQAGQAAIDAVVQQYQRETGYAPVVFAGSSMGSACFGHLRLLRQP